MIQCELKGDRPGRGLAVLAFLPHIPQEQLPCPGMAYCRSPPTQARTAATPPSPYELVDLPGIPTGWQEGGHRLARACEVRRTAVERCGRGGVERDGFGWGRARVVSPTVLAAVDGVRHLNSINDRPDEPLAVAEGDRS